MTHWLQIANIVRLPAGDNIKTVSPGIARNVVTHKTIAIRILVTASPPDCSINFSHNGIVLACSQAHETVI
jgi:hypothetical protein